MSGIFVGSAYIRPGERLRAALGAALGLALVGAIGFWLNRRFGVPLGLIAPLGASSVLLFAVPASPLAQPWSVLGGNAIAAVVGVLAARFIAPVELAAGVGVGLAIGLMASARCLHPPSGAVALTAVLGMAQAQGAGVFILASVMGNSVLLLASAWAFHALTGHVYPEFRRKSVSSVAPAREAATADAINEVLQASDDLLDISSEGLRALYDKISLRLALGRLAAPDCRAIMARAPEALEPGLPLHKAFENVLRAPGHAMLVTDESAHVIGLVSVDDFARRADLAGEKVRVAFSRRLHNAARLRSAPNHVVSDIMHHEVPSVRATDPASRAILTLVESGAPFVPVLNEARRLIGVIHARSAFAMLAREPARTG